MRLKPQLQRRRFIASRININTNTFNRRERKEGPDEIEIKISWGKRKVHKVNKPTKLKLLHGLIADS